MALQDYVPQIMVLLDNWAFRILFILVILGITSIIAKVFNYLTKRYFHMSSHHLKIDRTRFSIMSKLITFLIYFIGLMVAGSTIPALRTVSLSLLTGAGVLAAVMGFASQQAVSNIINGIFIAIFKPFRVGDRIFVNNETGDVEDITLRHTVIKNFENKRIIIPNSIIGNEPVTNYSIGDERICKYINIGISYDSDIKKAIKVIQDVTVKHPLWLDVRTDEDKKAKKPAVPVYVLNFGDSSVNLRAYVWTASPTDAFKINSDLHRLIKERFDRSGIEIPFPYRTIVYKKGTMKAKRKRRKK